MFQVFEGRTANEAWDKIATLFRANTGVLTQTSRFGATREILHAAISVSRPPATLGGCKEPADEHCLRYGRSSLDNGWSE